ncbi:uncharacterized protein LOC141895197 isoform X2 [Acropora palmata]|uniref:uncharacterized protein LOC141895197 isoform X2 n=1 Tax=Acropora palmata TaxID=6131 RepID=UPI003D9FF906
MLKQNMETNRFEDQENQPVGVVALVTPSRQPFKSVQDRRVNSGNLRRSLHSDLSKKTLLKGKQRRKRLSAPVNTLHQLIPRLVKSTEATSRIQEKSLECDKVLPLKCNDEECIKDFAENVVGRILTEVHKNSKVNTEKESSLKKMEEYESIILQMNKERLRLERQIAQLMKEQMRRKQPICGTGSTTASILEKELESKDHEFSELKGNCQQLQELLLELPVLKNELQKSKQETKAVNQLLLQCRKSNAEFKEYTATLNMQMKDTKLLSEQQKELHKRIGDIQRERDENVGKFQRLSELLKEREVEIQRNKEHCVALKGLVDRLEIAASDAEKNLAMSREKETVLHYQIDELNLSLEKNMQLLYDTQIHVGDVEDKLKKSREKENELNKEYGKLVEQRDCLTSDVDLHKMEISRQEHLLCRQQREITDLKLKLQNALEQMEQIQSQQQEVNEFTEEERRNLEDTVVEMEKMLKQSKLEKTELDASFKNQSIKFEEIVKEMKLSRGLLRDKQEELDATQCQAHWIVLQQESIIAETSKELIVISDLVNDWLSKFSNQNELEEENKGEDRSEISIKEYPRTEDESFPTPKSLVQSVLEATSMRENKTQSPALPKADDLCVQLHPIFEESESELSCPQVTNGDAEKPPTLNEQAMGLKQSLKQLATVISSQTPSLRDKNTIQRLQQQRILTEEEHKSALAKLTSELEDCRMSENKLLQENSSRCNKILLLQQQLKETTENLQQSWKKLDSLGEQYEDTFQQQNKIMELTDNIKQLSEEVKKLQGENQSLTQQLNDSLARLSDQSQDGLGEVLEEKFNLEKKIQTLKEKSLAYRLETQDYIAEYKYRTDSKIRVLEINIQKAEVEICRLDELVEKIRFVLHKHDDMVSSFPDINKLLSFLDGQDVHLSD